MFRINFVEFIGELLTIRCREMGLDRVFLDRGGYIFCGYVKFFSSWVCDFNYKNGLY